MKKWFQKKTDKNKEHHHKQLNRKQHYVNKYLNSEKCFHFYQQLNLETPYIHNSKVKQLFPTIEAVIDKSNQQAYFNSLQISHHTTSPVIAIFAVGFHHKRGSEIEFSYPDITQNTLFNSIQNITEDIEEIFNKVTTFALPDAVHNADEDYMYFNFNCRIKEKQTVIFGVTCFKQIKVTEEMRKSDPELTRGHLQKAICLLSLEPLFGYFKERLEPTIRAHFELQNFKDTSLIQFAYENIQQTLTYQNCISNLDISSIYIDTNLKAFFWIFKDKALKILMALILEMKILVFSLSSSVCSKFIITLLSMIPGVLNFNLRTKKSEILKAFKENYGLPLKIFNSEYRLLMHFSVNDLPQLDDKLKGYLIGTTNKFIKTLPKLDPDLIIDVDNESVQIMQEWHKKLLNAKHNAKQLYSQIYNQSLKQVDKDQGMYLKRFIQIQNNEDWIRKHVHEYILQYLSEISYFVSTLQLFDQRITKLLKDKENNNNEDCDEEEPQEQEVNIIKELQIKEIKQRLHGLFRIIQKYNRKGVAYWLTKTNNGMEWLESHDQSIQLNSEMYDLQNNTEIHRVFPNGDIYVGKLNYAALLEIQNLRVYQGQFLNFQKHGEGKYESLSEKVYQYKGSFQSNQFHGEGQLFVKDQFSYKGHFEHNQFNGYGNLQKQDSVYEGWFKNDLYEGTGKLIMPSNDEKEDKKSSTIYVGSFMNGLFHGEGQYVWPNGDIYKGQFKEGKKHGMGIFQSQEYTYQGEYINDNMDGFGELQFLNQFKIQGLFYNNQPKEGEQMIIKYPDNTIYQGTISKYLPNGKGYLAKQDGSYFEGEFIDGIAKE